MAAEGHLVTETSKRHVYDSLPVPAPSKKKKMESTEGCDEMLEKAFTILTSTAVAAASAEEECRSFGCLISNKMRNYLPGTRKQVQHKLSSIIFAADQGHFDVSYLVHAPSPAFHASSPTTPSSVAGS